MIRHTASSNPVLFRGLSVVSLMVAMVCGCGVEKADFFMRDRPRIVEPTPEGDRAYYLVHVGDSPSLVFRSKLAFCDYAVMHDESTDAIEDCGPDLSSAFEWPYTFKEVTPPGAATRLTVSGYSLAGQRDNMPYHGKLMELELGDDPTDKVAASAEMFVRVYQSRLVIPVDMAGKEPLWRAARLEMEGRGIRKRRIPHSSEPRKGHFTVEDAGGGGRYRVIYEPNIKEIDPTGTTSARLRVPDEDGHFHDFDAVLPPPNMSTMSNSGGADGAMQPMPGAS